MPPPARCWLYRVAGEADGLTPGGVAVGDVELASEPIQVIVDDATALERMAAAAARARAATDRDVLWAGQASRRTTGGRSAIGTVIRSSRNGLVSTRGSTATLRPRAIRCISSLMLFIAPGSAGFRCRVSPARSAICRLARCSSGWDAGSR